MENLEKKVNFVTYSEDLDFVNAYLERYEVPFSVVWIKDGIVMLEIVAVPNMAQVIFNMGAEIANQKIRKL